MSYWIVTAFIMFCVLLASISASKRIQPLTTFWIGLAILLSTIIN
jgi:hypothetical protein